MLHGDIRLPANSVGSAGIAFKFARGKTHSLADDATALDDADDTCHGDTADAYHSRILREYSSGSHGGDFSRAISAHKGNYEPPHENRAGKNHKGIFQTNDIAQTEYGGTTVA